VGEAGVWVIGHPHVPWLCGQISPEAMIYHALDYPAAFQTSMEAIYQASCVVFDIATEAGIDFMSESGYGLEMISPDRFAAQDLPYTRRLADWTHERGGLFWVHNCGQTRALIRDGQFDRLGADVIETIAPPPEGDNDLGESRGSLSPAICSKGNLSLGLLRDGCVEDVIEATREMVRAVQGYAHIHSTADAVYAETPAENFVAFVRTAREEAEKLA
jgi:uroporphyrinogen-III decarboxylase